MTADADTFEAHCAVAGMAGVYVLGSLAKRVTFYAQQRRAFSLIWSLLESRRLKPGQSLAVVGGGLAGLTAAAAAYSKGVGVTVYERETMLTHLQHGVSHRYIHPNYFDWPGRNFARKDAGLPLLDWSAGICHQVVSSIAAEWRSLFEGPGRIEVRLGSDVARIDHDTEGRPVVLPLGRESERRGFDAVILAVGFGLEKRIYPIPFLSYWRIDNLTQAPVGVGLPKKFLVAGAGDGGLIDLIRLRIGDFHQEALARDFYAAVGDEDRRTYTRLGAKLRDVEAKVARAAAEASADGKVSPVFDPEALIEREYRSIFESLRDQCPASMMQGLESETANPEPAGGRSTVEQARAELERRKRFGKPVAGRNLLIAKIRTRLRVETHVTLVDRRSQPTSLNSSLINRFTAFLIREIDPNTVYVSGHLGGVEILKGARDGKDNEGLRYRANLIRADQSSSTQDFDDVIVRIGPDPSSALLKLLDSAAIEDLKRRGEHAMERTDNPEPPWGKKSGYFKPPRPPLVRDLFEKAMRHLPSAVRQFYLDSVTAISVSRDDKGEFYLVDLKTAPSEKLRKTIGGVRVVYRLGEPLTLLPPPRPKARPTSGEPMPLSCGLDVQNLARQGRTLGAGGSTGATVGCFVETADGQVGFLSTNAGIAALNMAKVGDPIVRLDVDRAPKDRIVARLRDFVPLEYLPQVSAGADSDPINLMSVALAVLWPGLAYYANFLPDRDLPRVRGVGRPQVGDVVYKYCGESGAEVGRGKVTAIETSVRVPGPGGLFRFDGMFAVEGQVGVPFGGEGDAGTLIVRDDGMALGMILLAESQGARVAAFPLDTALERLGCRLILSDPRKSH